MKKKNMTKKMLRLAKGMLRITTSFFFCGFLSDNFTIKMDVLHFFSFFVLMIFQNNGINIFFFYIKISNK